MRKVVIASTLVAFLWLSWIFQRVIFYLADIEWDSGKLGQWGDTFGALSSLFSAAAFIGAIYAIYQQQMQIDRARSDQHLINEESLREQHRQRFETTFFEMLRLLREVRNEVEFVFRGVETLANGQSRATAHVHKGGAAFRVAWGQLLHAIGEKEPERDRAVVGRLYNDIVHKEHEDSFSPYFRLLYTVLIRIRDDQYLTTEQKDNYARLLRSQLTSYDLTLAGINGLSPVSNNFGDLLTEFKMFKYIPPGYRLRILKLHYPESAFISRD